MWTVEKTQICIRSTLGDVEVEEVAIENSLDTAGDDCDEVVEAFGVVAVDPIEDIESAVDAKCKEVVRGDRFSFACLADQVQLRQYSY